MPDHVRDVDLFTRRYSARPYGPLFFFPDNVPNTELTHVMAEDIPPGALVVRYDARGRAETPCGSPSSE
jgi:hypothetical protein